MRKSVFWLFTLLASLCLSLGTVYAQQLPQTSITILVNRDGVNVRVAPALGAEVLGFVQAGWTAPATGRSPDNQWVRIDFNGQEGWIGLAVINVFGDLNSLPVADPRSIPYGGFESPRSGTTSASSAITGRLALSGLRLRAGPGTAYPVLANPLRYTVFPLLGRTANNAWLQVNYNGTLGWLVTEWVEIQNGASIISLPIDGIVADAAPVSEDSADNYIGTLRLMLARIDLAQPSLDSIRGTWTTVALGQRSACQNFPARPSDMNIANPLLAAFYPTLNPLLADFNTAMTNLRLAIDLWLEACRQPSPPSGVIGQATVQGALGTIQTVDAQFGDLRRRLNELIPPEVVIGPDECLFTFREQFDVLKIVSLGQLRLDSFDQRKTATGYCIDLPAGAALRIEVLRINNNMEPLVSFSPLDNPTQFLAVGRGITGQNLVTLGPILISQAGRYLIVLSDAAEPPVAGDYALLVSNIAGMAILGPGLGIDPVTGQVVVNPVQAVSPAIPGLVVTATAAGGTACPSTGFSCSQLFTCQEARACLAAGNFSLDPDSDGIPCEDVPLNCT
jgi:uncharacterized protein YraI